MKSMSENSPFRRVAILGTGLIGGSFGLALRDRFPGTIISGFDRPQVLDCALVRGAITEGSRDLANAVRGADLVYLALPVGAAIDSLAAVAAAAAPHALVTDASSTKVVICTAAKDHFKSGARFLGGHPMAGKESSGVGGADANLFRGARYALISTEPDSDPRVQAFASLLRQMGAQPVYLDADTHDWAAAIISHLPQMCALALARVVQDETDETGLPLALAGEGLRSALRLAGSPYGMWRDIGLTNKHNIVRALDRLSQAVDHLRTNLASRELEQEFAVANDLYKTLNKLQ